MAIKLSLRTQEEEILPQTEDWDEELKFVHRPPGRMFWENGKTFLRFVSRQQKKKKKKKRNGTQCHYKKTHGRFHGHPHSTKEGPLIPGAPGVFRTRL